MEVVYSTIKKDNNAKLKNIIDDRLTEFNREKCEWFRDKFNSNQDEYEEEQHNFLVFDEDKLIGGVIGFIKYNWYYLDLLYVDEEYRKQDIGTELLKQIEELARKEKLTGVRMDTWSFQARGFYEKNGYQVYGQIENCPPGATDYFLKKEI